MLQQINIGSQNGSNLVSYVLIVGEVIAVGALMDELLPLDIILVTSYRIK